ncbi:MAG: hypothetical protein N3E37_04940 [Candidatus Micrarchaeota archaeon]|nr:hypothetical protein [Candidatus Micrarchaeota archaeon]
MKTKTTNKKSNKHGQYNHNPLVKRFIIICGLPASGKSLAEKVCKKLDIASFEMSKILKNFIKKSSDENIKKHKSKNLRELGHLIRELYGKDFVAKLTLNEIKKRKVNVGVIIGSRNIEEIEYFKNALGKNNVVVVYIEVEEMLRLERWIKRNKNSDPKNLEQANQMTINELNYGITEIKKKADVVVKNNGTEKEFLNNIEDIIYKNIKF